MKRVGPAPYDGSKSQMQTRRDLVRSAGGLALSALLAKTTLAAASPPRPDLWYVHPELRAVAGAINAAGGMIPPLNQASLPEVRKRMGGVAGPPLSTPAVEKKTVMGPAGAPAVAFYLMNAGQGEAKPLIVHMHGGGYIGGNVLGTIASLQELAANLDCAIATVDYRLAPETTYAGSVEDNYAVLHWLHRNAAEVGIDPNRIAVMGESAGGGHAALLALRARDRGEVPLCFQMLSYPMLDDRTGSTRMPRPPAGSIVWTAEHNRFAWGAFLGVEPGSSRVPSAAVPARHAKLDGLPPTFIGVGSIDLFVDEDVDYARRLIDAGVTTELHVVPGAFHIFDAIASGSSVAKAFGAARVDALRRAFAVQAA